MLARAASQCRQGAASRLAISAAQQRGLALFDSLFGDSSNWFAGGKGPEAEVYCIDPKLVLEPEKLKAAKLDQVATLLKVPRELVPKLSQGTMELADMDEPGNNWYFGDERAEIFEYKLLGEVPAQSGFTSFLYRDTLDRIRTGEAQGLPSWAQFTELTSDTVKWPTRKTPFLFAGRIVEASAAALYVLEREGQVKGVLVSSESSGGLAGSEND
ncbi:hypothetical protein HYH03_018419 [Edaphochlamys debaryana]|uniref:Uncharacterized protein n=1 Tax=Edaphochlamys debaryana TaxID=47281 RepID=A0A835XHY4_9CHLO|nr:hypothetical protein HYH03_018419 [Edaphochlamys debaryana]|eukprot:KAG2482646.1 hypothetical protein HYH03_018419 [Edaphochlamys debaryana]